MTSEERNKSAGTVYDELGRAARERLKGPLGTNPPVPEQEKPEDDSELPNPIGYAGGCGARGIHLDEADWEQLR